MAIMAKGRKSSSRLATFSFESMQEEVDEEISTEKIGTKLLEDLRVLNLKRVEHVSPNIVLCPVIVKFGLALACSIARVVPSLPVLPIDVRRQVVKILCPHVSEEDGDTLLQCAASLPDFHNTTATESDMSSTFSHLHVIVVSRIWCDTTILWKWTTTISMALAKA